MALRFIDSFDHYDTDTWTKKWRWLHDNTGASITIESSEGRFGTGGAVINDFLSQFEFGRTFDDQPTWIVGFAVKCLDSKTSPDLYSLLEFHDGFSNATAGDTGQVRLYLTALGHLELRRGHAPTTPFAEVTLARSAKTLAQGTFEYIETKVTINSAGSWEVRVNGEVWLSGSGDTNVTANNSANVIGIGTSYGPSGDGGGSNRDIVFDDLYICDATGSENNDFLGDVRVERLLPIATAQSQWSLFDSGDVAVENYEVVDEGATPDDDLTFVAGSVAGQRDLYQFENPTIQAGTVYGLQTHMYARKTGAGSRTIRHVVVASGTHQGSVIYFDGNYDYLIELFETNPISASNWTLAEINAIELGMEIES